MEGGGKGRERWREWERERRVGMKKEWNKEEEARRERKEGRKGEK
jgi:hypothetical protein